MKRFWDRKKVLYGLISACLFLLLLVLTFRPRLSEQPGWVDMVVFGDSVCGGIRDETGVTAQLGELTQMSVLNGALGGTCISRIDRECRLDYAKDSLSLAGLTKAVMARDFGVQQAFRIRESNTEYFENVVDELERIDFATVKLVVIYHGLNDYYNGVPIANEADPYDEYTFSGALRSSLRALQRANPDMRIVLVTPTYIWYESQGLTCEEYDGGGGILEDYVQAEMEIAEEFGLEVVDLYHDFFPHDSWEDWEQYTQDGTHPNEAGRDKIAREIARHILGNQSVEVRGEVR